MSLCLRAMRARSARLDLCLRVGLAIAAASLLAACAPAPAADVPPPATPVGDLSPFEALTPVWDNGQTQASVDVRAYIEPYCQTPACVAYIQQTLPALASLSNARVRIYDYPLSQIAESFMVAGIGRCVAQESPDFYLRYLEEASRSTALKDELEMYRIAREVAGKRYDTRCLQREIRKIKTLFENNNPLGLARVPVTLINTGNTAQLIEGALTSDQITRRAGDRSP